MKAAVVVVAVGVSPKLSAQIIVRLILGVLKVVFPIRRSLPDVDNGSWDAILGHEIGDTSMHQGHLPLVGTLYDAVPKLTERCIRAPKWSQDRRRGGYLIRLACVLVCNFIN